MEGVFCFLMEKGSVRHCFFFFFSPVLEDKIKRRNYTYGGAFFLVKNKMR